MQLQHILSSRRINAVNEFLAFFVNCEVKKYLLKFLKIFQKEDFVLENAGKNVEKFFGGGHFQNFLNQQNLEYKLKLLLNSAFNIKF
jgi:hypothetical protein